MTPTPELQELFNVEPGGKAFEEKYNLLDVRGQCLMNSLALMPEDKFNNMLCWLEQNQKEAAV
jgi:hypothetical protein